MPARMERARNSHRDKAIEIAAKYSKGEATDAKK